MPLFSYVTENGRLTYTSPNQEFHMSYGERILVVVWSSSKTISDEVFESHCQVSQEWFLTFPGRLALVCSTAFSPSAAQRRIVKKYEKEMFREMNRVAFITDSRIVRGALTAFSWVLTKRMQSKGFAPARYADGIAWMAEAQGFDQPNLENALLAANAAIGNPELQK